MKMLRKEEIEFLVKVIGSLEDAGMKLEQAYNSEDFDSFAKIKSFMEKIQRIIDEITVRQGEIK